MPSPVLRRQKTSGSLAIGTGCIPAGTARSSKDCGRVPGARIELRLAGPDLACDHARRATMFAEAAGTDRFKSDHPPSVEGRPPHFPLRITAKGFTTLATRQYAETGKSSADFDIVLVPARGPRPLFPVDKAGPVWYKCSAMQSMRIHAPLSRLLIALTAAVALLTVTGCGGKKPAPQPTAPDGSKLKGHQRPYTVMGKRYEPLKSHVGFTQEGIASWYGKDFHGKKTSNGETYDMYAMTAAHKTLPLGVFVKVRNTENGQETVVRVNDRGPFVKNRVIDLSYSAAKTLGVDQKGTAPVRIEALGYKAGGSSAVEYKEPETYDSGNYSVQIGAFKDQQNAARLSGEMKKLHGYSEVRSATVNGELFYRVHAGKYTSLQTAEEAEGNFARHGYPGSFVVSLD